MSSIASMSGWAAVSPFASIALSSGRNPSAKPDDIAIPATAYSRMASRRVSTSSFMSAPSGNGCVGASIVSRKRVGTHTTHQMRGQAIDDMAKAAVPGPVG